MILASKLFKPIHRLFTVMLFGCLCAGCLKLEHTITSPGARGIVMDAQTKAPLRGATVVVSRTQFGSPSPTVAEALTNTRPPSVTTGRSGRFCVPAEGHWHCVADYLIAPPRNPGGTLVVQRAGYEPVALPL